MQYDPFQQKAIDELKQNHSVIVAAPTGAGKTVIAEHVIEDCLQNDKKVIYTAPIKALSNQKYRDFSVRFPDRVGILTGDVSINPHASALIMTTEIFRNKILEENSSLTDYAWIIFDEIHYLDDYERGSVWEESLMFLPDHMNVLGLSATVPNVDELAAWFQSVHHRPLKVIKEHRRPVPLHVYYQCQNEIYDKFPVLAKYGFRSPQMPSLKGGRIPRHVHLKPNKLSSLFKQLIDNDLLPCIYFVFSRRRTEFLAEETLGFDLLTADERSRVLALFDELCARFELDAEPSAAKIRPFIERGIAYHHAGMLPTLKEVIERLFTSRLIKAIFTTETFALGINMPARTVIFDELRKFYGRSFGVLKTRDFYQMAGRAGRRSIDTEGHVFCRVNPHYITSSQLRKVVHDQPEEVHSRFNAAYATILNLYAHYQERLYDVYPLSFHYFQENKRFRKKALDVLRSKVQLLKELGYIRRNELTAKGKFAANVYGYELLLTELYEDGTVDRLTEKELGILVAALVYEPRKADTRPVLDKPVRRLERITDKVIDRINRMERRARIKPPSKRCFYHLAPAMEGWLQGRDFDEVLDATSADEGEVIRYFRMSIQILREIKDAPVSDQLKGKVGSLIRKINRGLVDSERQLRTEI